MPPPVVGGVLPEEVVASQPPTNSNVEEKILSWEVAKETRWAPNVPKDTESEQASTLLVAQDPGGTHTPNPKVTKNPTSR